MNEWAWSHEELRRVGHRVVDLIADHLVNLPARPVFRPFPQKLREKYLRSGSLQSDGASADEILDAFEQEIAAFPFGNGHPRFYGWVNSPPAPIGVFADALAAAMNPSCAGGNHAAIYVERQVINWFKQLIGFPDDAMGLLVSGGSMAAITALAVARQVRCGFDIRAKGLQSSPTPLVFYRTRETHSCHQKAIELLGIGSDHFREVAHDSALRMLPAALEEAINEDKSRGRTPVAVIATAGTVNTGAIDPIDKIAKVCSRQNVWLHVDAAYGGAAIFSKQFYTRISAIAHADSVALDPHKWLYVPVEAGLALVRSGDAMRSAFSLVPAYLQTDGDLAGVQGPPWFSEYGFAQTRGFRALKLWMTLRFYGTEGYRRCIEKDISLAHRLAASLRDAADFAIYEPQSLSIVCFRYLPDQEKTDQALNDFNRQLLKNIQLSGRLFLSGTMIDGRFWLRACIVNPRAQAEDIEAILPVVRELAQTTATPL